MESITVSLDEFEIKVLKSDRIVLEILLPINYGDIFRF